MKTGTIVQAVTLILLLASAASCEVSKEYTSKLFRPAATKKNDSSFVKFMQKDTVTASVNTSETGNAGSVQEKVYSNSTASTEEKVPAVVPKSNGVRTKRQRQ